MPWKIEFERNAERDLEKLDHQIAGKLLKFLYTRVAPAEDPRSLGEALKGPVLGDFGNIVWETIA